MNNDIKINSRSEINTELQIKRPNKTKEKKTKKEKDLHISRATNLKLNIDTQLSTHTRSGELMLFLFLIMWPAQRGVRWGTRPGTTNCPLHPGLLNAKIKNKKIILSVYLRLQFSVLMSVQSLNQCLLSRHIRNAGMNYKCSHAVPHSFQ